MNLLTDPLWQADTLGSPLPPTDFGVSVSLPLWEHVIGYEEGKQEVVSKFRSGYPRFFLPPAIANLFTAAERDLATPGERCLVFPRVIHAERCKAWIHRHQGEGHDVRVVPYTNDALGACIFPAGDYDIARKFWRFAGEVVSARQSLHAVGKLAADTTAGDAAIKAVRERLATLSGQSLDDVFLFPSGMAATFAAHRMLSAFYPDAKTIQLGFPYVDVLKVQQFFGAGVHSLPVIDDAAYAEVNELVGSETIAGLFAEVPTNPLLQCPDFTRLHLGEVPVVLDDTIGSVVNVDAFRFADMVTTSLTKGFSGVGDVLAGSLILNRKSRHYAKFAAWMRANSDHTLFAGDAIALEQNSRDVVERTAVMSRNSCGLYEYLSKHPKVQHVWHSINEGGSGYKSMQRENNQHGCLFSFVLKERARTPAFYDALAVCKGPSLGSNFTLVCPYTLLAHYDEIAWTEQCGVPRELIRVSAGVEPLGDLVARFERALAVV